MSRTIAPGPGAASRRSRGKGRAQERAAFTEPVNRPSVRGSGVRGARAASGDHSSVRGAMYSPSEYGSRVGGGRGRGTGRGRGIDPNDDQDNWEENGEPDGPQGQSQEQRAQYTGAYTVISPNEKKRRQITQQAEREARQYEEYKQQNKPTKVSYVGTAGGGETMSLAEARQQQIRANPTKTNRLIREQERREIQKQAEEREHAEKKNSARRKAEQNEQRQREQQEVWRSDMHRVNQAFLDRLEAQGKAKAQTIQPQPSGSTSHKPGANPASSAWPSPSGGRFDLRGGNENTAGGAKPKARQPQHTTTQSTSAEDSGQYSWHSSGDTARDRFDSEPEHDAHFYTNLNILQGMFPSYTQAALVSILQDSNGSMDDALHLLGV